MHGRTERETTIELYQPRDANLLRGAHQRSERSFSGKRARKRNDRPTSFYSSRLQSTLSALDGRAAALCCRAAGRARHERTRSPAMRARPAPPRRSRRAVLHQGCAGLQGWPLEGPRRLRRCCKVCSLPPALHAHAHAPRSRVIMASRHRGASLTRTRRRPRRRASARSSASRWPLSTRCIGSRAPLARPSRSSQGSSASVAGPRSAGRRMSRRRFSPPSPVLSLVCARRPRRASCRRV
jgi:hypothetical protein